MCDATGQYRLPGSQLKGSAKLDLLKKEYT